MQHVQLFHCATCQGSFYTKNEYITFLSKIWCWIFFYSTIFSKKKTSEKTAKNCWGGAFNNFLGKEGVLRQKLTKLFYHKWGIEYLIFYQFFPKMYNFLRKRHNTVSGPQASLKKRMRPATRIDITFLMGNEVSNISSFNNFFEKRNIFGDNGEKILGGHDHFLGERVILRQK